MSLVGCTDTNETQEKDISQTVTLTKTPDSDYMKTFEELSLGWLSDFHMKWENADKTGIRVWAEGYENGVKLEDNLFDIGIGNSPNTVEDGSFGYGLIESNGSEPLIFFYHPGGSLTPQKVPMDIFTGTMWTWDYAIGEEEIHLEPGETRILAVYRETSGNSMESGYNYEDEDEIEELLSSTDKVILFKLKVLEDDAEAATKGN